MKSPLLRITDLKKLTEAVRCAGFAPRLIYRPDGSVIVEPVAPASLTGTDKSDWD